MIELIQHLQSEGYQARDVIPDGKLHRFAMDAKDSKESGYYVAFQNFSSKTGAAFYVLVYGDWRSGEQRSHCTLQGPSSAEDKKLIKKKIEESQKRAEAEKRDIQLRVSEEVEAIWKKAPTSGEAPYLNKKQIVECPDLGIRYEFAGAFYVPMQDIEGKIWSLQKIDGGGAKLFYPGGRVSECFHLLGSIAASDRILLCEGLATGASLRLATGLPVVVAFNSGNLKNVAGVLRAAHPEKRFLICGDDDRWSRRQDGTPFNPGREAAETAARNCAGKAVFPKFEEAQEGFTDFNDLHTVEGIEVVREQILNIPVERVGVFALGFKEKEYFFTSSTNRQITAISKFSRSDLTGIMPIEYWESIYPSAGQGRVDWDSAMSKMQSEARKRGIFQSRNVRGSGVWHDEGRVVVNMGDHLVVDGERVELGSLKSRYFYTLGVSLSGLHPSPLSARECDPLLKACETFKWVKSDFGFLLAGSLVVSRVCGALPIHPHVWLTGGSHTGKSTLLERLIQPMLGANMLYVRGGTTEAGVRQSLRADALPVLFDEFETNGKRSAENIQALVELMRAAWSDSNAMVVKGGSSGNASCFSVNFCSIVSSIRAKLLNDADRSRFAVIELAPHQSDAEHWKLLDGYLGKINVEYGDRLFSRTIRLLPVLLANFKTMKAALAQRVSSRFGDQYGMLLAGYSLLMQDEPMSSEQAILLADHVSLTDEREEAKVADHEECLNHLLTKKLRFERDTKVYERSVSELILEARTDKWCDDALQRLGIKVTFQAVAIAASHSELESQVYRDTRWSQTWANSLSRIPGAIKNKSSWMAGKNQKAVSMPGSIFGF